MNVKTLCLAILFDRDASGYEIRKLSTESDYAFFVDASFGSIYPALTKLEDEGFVVGHMQIQEGKPSKKIYHITDAGRAEFEKSLFEKLGDDVFRSEFLLFARFASILPASLVEQRLCERIENLDRKTAWLTALLQNGISSSDEWVINYGINVIGVERQYIETHMDQLVANAKPATQEANAE